MRPDAPINPAERAALAYVIGGPHEAGEDHPSVLGLNNSVLVANRLAALKAEKKRIEKDYPGRTASTQARVDRANALLSESPLPAFVSIRVGWLTKRLVPSP